MNDQNQDNSLAVAPRCLFYVWVRQHDGTHSRDFKSTGAKKSCKFCFNYWAYALLEVLLSGDEALLTPWYVHLVLHICLGRIDFGCESLFRRTLGSTYTHAKRELLYVDDVDGGRISRRRGSRTFLQTT